MQIKIDKNNPVSNTRAEKYFGSQIEKFFGHYDFINSITVFFRGQKHKMKKIKMHARLKGKELYVEASGRLHDIAFELASQKLKAQVEKYKSKHYNGKGGVKG